VICAAVVFAMAVEAPARAAMVLVPSACAMLLHGGFARSRQAIGWMFAALAAGYLVSGWIARGHMLHGIPPYQLSNYSSLADRAGQLGHRLVDDYFGFAPFANATSRALPLFLYALKSAFVLGFAAVFIALCVNRVRRAIPAGTGQPDEFVGLVGVAHVVFGAWIALAIRYDEADVRHFLWGLMLVKLFVVVRALRWSSSFLRFRVAAWGAICIALLLSAYTTIYLTTRPRADVLHSFLRVRRALLHEALRARIQELGIANVYGTYWVVQPVEVFVSGARAAPLSVTGGRVDFFDTLTVPSRRCAKGMVLYATEGLDGDQAALRGAVLSRGGVVLDELPDARAVLAGPPVWNQEGCT
jgi:hypothetical protein